MLDDGGILFRLPVGVKDFFLSSLTRLCLLWGTRNGYLGDFLPDVTRLVSQVDHRNASPRLRMCQLHTLL